MTLVRIARVIGPFGVRGELRLESTSDHPEQIGQRPEYLLVDPKSREFETVAVTGLELREHDLLITIAGYSAPEPLRRFSGWELCYSAERGELPRDEGEFYYFELVGLEARNPEGEVLGKVIDASHNGAHVVLEIEGFRQMLPFTEQFVPEVNLNDGYLVTTYPLEQPVEKKKRVWHSRRLKG